MVHQTRAITADNGKIFALKQTLSCSNYGTYVAYMLFMSQTIYWPHHKTNFQKAGAITDLFGINLNTTIKQHY